MESTSQIVEPSSENHPSQMPIPRSEFEHYLKEHKSIPKYDHSGEAKPRHPWFEIDKAEVDRQIHEFATRVLGALVGVPHHDKELDHLQRIANTISQVHRSPPIKVALVGAQGAGKSLLTNALFSCDGLSLTGADGAACTSAVITYADYPSGATDENVRFFAEVKFLNAAKREEMVKEHARSFHYFHDEDDDSDIDDDDALKSVPREGDESDRRAKDTAEDVFITLFGSMEAFLECWSLEAYKNGEFVHICQHKCQAAIEKLDTDSEGIAQFSAKDQRELITKIKPFLTKVKGQVCLWPLVDSVRIRFKHDLLTQGIELLDVPGWGDINLSRTRHAEQIRESVDVEIIVADTLRITTDDAVINNTRASIAVRGAINVKLVATKIDAITSNQLEQCTGFPYDQIWQMIETADEEESRAEDDDNEAAREVISKHKMYLHRHLKQQKVVERSRNISAELTTKFYTKSPTDNPEVFHASASNYMDWIRKPKIQFDRQPALSPELTGIPSIRHFLYSLPAQRNLTDYAMHLNVVIPSFIEKVWRAVSDSDRDTGFRELADRFDQIRSEFMTQMRSQAKTAFRDLSKNGMAKTRNDSDTFRQQIERLIRKDWSILPPFSFKKLVACKGVVLKGVSKARGIQNGRNWNQEIAGIVAPGFSKFLVWHTKHMVTMGPSLSAALHQAYRLTIKMMENSSANVVVVDKARKKWEAVYPKMEAKIATLMRKIDKGERALVDWATARHGKENNLVAQEMEEIYDAVFTAEPPLKEITSGKRKGQKRYVTSKLKYQKETLLELTCTSKLHLVDNLMNRFQEEFNKHINDLLEAHFEDLNKLFDDYSATLRKQSPIDYEITPVGADIRMKLEKLIPDLEAKSKELQAQLPMVIKDENADDAPADWKCSEDTDETIGEIFKRLSKQKRSGGTGGSRKRIKNEC